MTPSATAAYSALQSFKPQSAQSVIQTADTQAGVNAAQTRVSDLRGSVNNLESALQAVDPSVTGRTTGTFTTEAQRSALVNKESQPIQTDLTSRNRDLNMAGADLSSAEGRSNTLASAILSQDKSTYQKLLDTYNAADAAAKQQEAIREFGVSQALENAKLKETAREANLTAANNTVGSPTLNLGNAGSSGPAANPGNGVNATYVQRSNDKGYNFFAPNGQTINAMQYSQITGIPFRNLLQMMANGGDSGAKAALGFVGNDFGYDPRKVTNSNLASLYQALTGRKASINTPPRPTQIAPTSLRMGF